MTALLLASIAANIGMAGLCAFLVGGWTRALNRQEAAHDL